MADLQVLKKKFVERFGGTEDGIRSFFAPGRVNLIGEHTDYNGGYVFPAALTFGTTMLVRKREDDIIRFASENFSMEAEITLDTAKFEKAHDWVNYPKAVLVHLAKRG
ncbi:MAG: galactokinase, partial [Gorillibacterium sp.]|nr:galactokinase [Gorillibacterium sp.]